MAARRLTAILAAAGGGLGLAAGAGPATALPDRAAILEYVARIEAPAGYNTVHSMAPEPTPKPLVEMRLAEVMDWQKHIRPHAVSTAVGRYQFIHATLVRLTAALMIDTDRLFDARLQDALANRLLDECGYGQRPVVAFANCLAGIWAALPMVAGPRAGRSAWHGAAGNRALVTRTEYMLFLTGSDERPIEDKRGGDPDLAGEIAITTPHAAIRFRRAERWTEPPVSENRDETGAGEPAAFRFPVDPYRMR